MSKLRTEDLQVRFGGVKAIDGVTLEVAPGSLTGLIGPNGAGKTTFIDALTGFVPSKGKVILGGHDLSGLSPDRRARAGLARTWQSLELFDDLTVLENLQVASEAGGSLAIARDLLWPKWRRTDQQVHAALAELGIAELANRAPAELSQGQRKLVGVARALASGATTVLMDEPAAGLDSGESRLLGIQLRTILKSGKTVLLVDHDMGLVLSTCDVIHVLEFGRIIASGVPQEIRSNERVLEAYLGERGRAEIEHRNPVPLLNPSAPAM